MHELTDHYPAAPWPASLKAISLLATLALCAVSFAAYRAAPALPGFTHYFGVGVALVPVALLLGTAFFMVRGFEISAGELAVKRLLGATRIPLAELRRVWLDPQVCKGSVRVAGNGGLFSYTGWFHNKRLGRYRLFATDFDNAVVLRFSNRVVVVTPATPHAFVDHLKRLIPRIAVGPEEEPGRLGGMK